MCPRLAHHSDRISCCCFSTLKNRPPPIGLFARRLFPETENTIIPEQVRKFPTEKWKRSGFVVREQLRKEGVLRMEAECK